jgi:hypothetical protein
LAPADMSHATGSDAIASPLDGSQPHPRRR